MNARVVVAGTLLAAVAVSLPPARAQSAPPPAGLEVVFNGENNRLNAYDAATGAKVTVIPSAADDPSSLDINGEICFVPDGVPWKPDGEIWFIAGEDTGQEDNRRKIGWGIFRLTGSTLADLAAEEVGKLVPDTYATQVSNPENFGCGVLPDGRIVTSDVGDQLPHQPATGQLIVWFPTADVLQHVGPDRNDFARVPHCKIDVQLATAGGIEVDGTDVLVTTNRPNPQTGEPAGVWRYGTRHWPTSETPEGCPGGVMVDAAAWRGKSLFIPAVPGIVLTPSDIVDSGRGSYYVSSVFSGQVAEFGKDGVFRRHVVNSAGQFGGITPFGIDVASDGTLWIADIGVVGPGPQDGEGSVVKVPIAADGTVGAMVTVDENLEFPDGIGITRLPAAPDQPRAIDSVPGEPAAPEGDELSRTGASVPVALAGALLALAVAVRRVSAAGA